MALGGGFLGGFCGISLREQGGGWRSREREMKEFIFAFSKAFPRSGSWANVGQLQDPFPTGLIGKGFSGAAFRWFTICAVFSKRTSSCFKLWVRGSHRARFGQTGLSHYFFCIWLVFHPFFALSLSQISVFWAITDHAHPNPHGNLWIMEIFASL